MEDVGGGDQLDRLGGVAGLLIGSHGMDEAMAFVSGGLAIVGIGHKIEKLKDPL